MTVSLTNVAASDGGTGGTGSVRVGFLLGDVNQSRIVAVTDWIVAVTDLIAVNNQLAKPLSVSNFLTDVNAPASSATSTRCSSTTTWRISCRRRNPALRCSKGVGGRAYALSASLPRGRRQVARAAAEA